MDGLALHSAMYACLETKENHGFSPGSRRGILPVWVYIPIIVVRIAATFEGCVFPCGHLLLFVRGFLCCLLLGSLANRGQAWWVVLGSFPFSLLSGYGGPFFSFSCLFLVNFPSLQSSYRKFHRTESALLKVKKWHFIKREQTACHLVCSVGFEHGFWYHWSRYLTWEA